MTPYHHTFHPVRRVDGRMVVADENEWLIIKNIHTVAAAYADEDNRKTLVIIGPEVFGDWEGPIVNDQADELYDDRSGGWSDRYGDKDGHRLKITIQDIRARLFRIIDQCPHVTFCIETDRPGEVGKMMPKTKCSCGRKADCYGSYENKPVSYACNECCGHGNEDGWCNCDWDGSRYNLWLGVGPIRTQADADRMCVELAQVPACLNYAVVQPKENIIFQGWDGKLSRNWLDPKHPRGINWLIIRGGEEPMHPQHVRSLVKQGEAADVPCWLEWGECIPSSQHGSFSTEERKTIAEFWDHVHLKTGTCDSIRVGRDRSGSTLDGREWRMVPGAVKPQEAT